MGGLEEGGKVSGMVPGLDATTGKQSLDAHDASRKRWIGCRKDRCMVFFVGSHKAERVWGWAGTHGSILFGSGPSPASK